MAVFPTVDLGAVARQQRQILAELGGMRDGLVVLTALVRRTDGTLSALLVEVRDLQQPAK